MNNNANVLKASVRVFEQAKAIQIMAAMNKIAYELLQDALEMRKGWLGFTGNLPTSYSVGVWDFNGNLEIYYAEDVDAGYSLSSVITSKIAKGDIKALSTPWEGEERAVRGQVDLTTRYGVELAKMFITQYKPRRLPCILMCTGAEYSQYIEKSREGANVLSDSAEPAFVKKVGDKIFAGIQFVARNMITR